MSAGKNIGAQGNGGVTLGPAGDACHVHAPVAPGANLPARKMTKGPMGYSVTSAAPTVTENRDLESRP